MEIGGKVALVTGAGAGIGRTISVRLARESASVVASDIEEAGGLGTVALIESSGGDAAFAMADAGVEVEFRAAVRFAVSKYGGLDIVVNNAGPYHADDPLGRWPETIQGNLVSAMNGILIGMEAMRERGGGAIVNIGSTSSLGYGRKHSPSPMYDAAKMAVMRLTTTLGYLGDAENIRVNCLVPDWVASDDVKGYFDSLTPEERVERGVPSKLISLEETADVVLKLLSDDTLAGRVMVMWSEGPWGMIPDGDVGYAGLE